MGWLNPLECGSWWGNPPKTQSGPPVVDLVKKAKAAELEDQGYARRQIARKLDVSPATITRWLGVPESRKGKRRKT
jgi:DNA invertase Pin-like site-specific DNA recombinase